MLPVPVLVMPDFVTGSPNLEAGTAHFFRSDGNVALYRFVMANDGWERGKYPSFMRIVQEEIAPGSQRKRRFRTVISLCTETTRDGLWSGLTGTGDLRPIINTLSWDIPQNVDNDTAVCASILTRTIVALMRGQENTSSDDTPNYANVFSPIVDSQALY